MRWVALVPALLAVACSSPSADPGGPADAGEDGVIGCTGDRLARTYAAGMTQKGASGAFWFVLASASPAPPALNTNTWRVKLLDASGRPVVGAKLQATPFMPRMNHGSSAMPSVTDDGDGIYTISTLYFFMPGLWTVTVVAQAGGKMDTGVFGFCVAG